jgi:hypothetical protein
MTIAPEQLLLDDIVTIDAGRVIVQFQTPITMKELQKYLRNNIIVNPNEAVEHTMIVTVFGTAN